MTPDDLIERLREADAEKAALRARVAELEGALQEIEIKGDTEWGGADCSVCASAALKGETG